MLRSVCSFVRLSHAPIAQQCILGLWLIQNTNRKSNPLVSVVVWPHAWPNANEAVAGPLQNHSTGGCTIDMLLTKGVA